jgi:hypothetical protein
MNFNDDDGINEQFNNLNRMPFKFINKIIDKINDNKYLIKITFRELMAESTPIIFNRELEQTKIDELYTSILDGYDIPFTIDAIYDPNTNIQEKNIKIINGNHRHGAICKYITECDKHFDCDFKVYVWIYVVVDCETTNVKQSIELYTKINNHLPFKKAIYVDIIATRFIDKLCSPETKRKHPIMKAILTTNGEKCQQPNINKKEVFNLLNNNKDITDSFLSKYSNTDDIISQFINNILEINHRLSIKDFNDLYSDNPSTKNKVYFDKAFKIGFFLNQKNSKYPKEEWIKFLCDPTRI